MARRFLPELGDAKRFSLELVDWVRWLEKKGYNVTADAQVYVSFPASKYKTRDAADDAFSDLSTDLDGYKGIESHSGDGGIERNGPYWDASWTIISNSYPKHTKVPSSEKELEALMKKSEDFESDTQFMETKFYTADGKMAAIIVHFDGSLELMR